ncbi:heavy metal-associated domain-containing protein [uncultured Lutibacter sp.]|uniref:heavy-metal-associated domain-containing protein n=1 Tax=uncultured Lutibacter sp. TaxID=437739 RepID=UPI00261CED86|nr:heavy metal-associated domain-containing protein [uncultured Lutibacter sp.]
MKKIIYLLVITMALISCKESKNEERLKTDSNKQVELTENLKSIEVDIEGMTCEIGCARLIQSKLSKVDGVTYTNVDFESKKGVITFDQNKLSAADISSNINKIAGGDLYSVSKTTELEEIITKMK